jgi:hypothetical protein
MIDLGRLGSFRLHRWLADDDDRAKHDHPADFWTLVLKGEYIDVGEYREVMRAGTLRKRKAEHIHYVHLMKWPTWTLLYFKPTRRKWGFYVPRKKDDKIKFVKSNKYFFEKGQHPCE